ncbi:RHS repeat-associated core domain-containing protein, partial [Candidatus Falkowbacteria bacterium]|nr:RHS repeat-associated core domain-containing protein [Candidatus Falkowbacteria bacterium]
YTGHEHLDEFGLINMNGRMYDPLLGRMLSPDNFVQAPDNSQNFNRYSYAMNNPLVYTDPDGEAIILSGIYGMLTSGFFYLVNNESNFNLGNFTGALVSGFVAGATGNIMSNFGIGGIKAGAITGGLTGLSNNLTSSIINSDDETFNNSISGLGIGSLLGGAMGGLDAYIKGSNIWNGKGKHVIKRYAIDGGDQTVKKTRYWNDGRIAKSNEVESEDLERAPHVREITWPKNYARQHYDDDLTIEVDAYPPTGQHFFVNVDDQQVLKLERPGKISITISKNLSKITWGLEGVPHRFADFFFPDVNVAGYTTVRPSSQINIYGNWRKWNGFLFWP